MMMATAYLHEQQLDWRCSTHIIIDVINEAAFSVLVLIATALFYAAWTLLQALWLRPLRIKRGFEAQGIKCLPFPSPRGNLPEMSALIQGARAMPMAELSHDIAPRILPHLYHWSKLHGDYFVFWFGPEAHFTLKEPEQAKEVLSTKFGHYRKPDRRPDMRDELGGLGLTNSEGERWAKHRRILNPAFLHEKLKAMAPIMAACTVAMMETWEAQVEKGLDIDVHVAFRNLTADIIAHTAFGSSFAEGRQVVEVQHEQQIIAEKITRTIYIPGSRFIPTPSNRHRWKLTKKTYNVLHQLIKKRLECLRKSAMADEYGNDLLGLMLAANQEDLQRSQNNTSMGIDEIIDECKAFFFAGHETTGTLLTWTFLLLASSPIWQERVREEVHAVCGTKELPTAELVNHLKTVSMVLNEALRLYPPAVVLFRKAPTDLQLGNILIHAGTVLIIPIITWHHDQRFWGPNATEFCPERFSSGIGKASTTSSAFMPFSMGPRNCIGQTFAMLEAKVVLSAILQRYRFRLSPAYIHAPTLILTLQPQFGMPLLFEKL